MDAAILTGDMILSLLLHRSPRLLHLSYWQLQAPLFQFSPPLGLGACSALFNLIPCCVNMKYILGSDGMLMLLTAIACTVCGVHILQNVDEDRCNYYHEEEEYWYDEEVDVNEVVFSVSSGEGRRLEHKCGSWLGWAVTMLVDAGLWFIAMVLLLVFIIRYNKLCNCNSGEAEDEEEVEGTADPEGTNTLPNNSNMYSDIGKEMEQTAKERNDN